MTMPDREPVQSSVVNSEKVDASPAEPETPSWEKKWQAFEDGGEDAVGVAATEQERRQAEEGVSREEWDRLSNDQRKAEFGKWYKKLQARKPIEDWQWQALKDSARDSVRERKRERKRAKLREKAERIRVGINAFGARGDALGERMARAAAQRAAADKGRLGEWARQKLAAEAPAETEEAVAAVDEAARQQAVEAARLAEERRQAEQAEVARMIIDELKAEAEAAGIVEELKAEAPEAVAPEKKAWREAAGEMAGDTFAIIGFENSGKNEIAAAAAFEFRTEIASGAMPREMFTAMMKKLNGIANSYEAQLGRPEEQKLPWPQVAGDMSRNNIAGIAFETTGSRIVAAAAYRFRQGILGIQDEGVQFKAMMREINGAVGKYRVGP